MYSHTQYLLYRISLLNWNITAPIWIFYNFQIKKEEIGYSSLKGDNVMKPDLEKENECPSVETYSQYTEQDLDKKHESS